MERTKCLLCDAEAVAIFYMDLGCICSRATRQPLCMQHVVKAQPSGSMELVEDLTKGHTFTRWWNGAREASVPSRK